jgi:hypothetical protein
VRRGAGRLVGGGVRVKVTFVDGPVHGQTADLDVRDALHELLVAVEPGGAWSVVGVHPPQHTMRAHLFSYRHAESEDGARRYVMVPWPDTAAWSASN